LRSAQRSGGGVAAVRAQPSRCAALARILRDASVAFTLPDHPRGCLLISAATNSTGESADVGARLRELRAANTAALEQRFLTAISAGELPQGVEAAAMARFYMATLQGMSAQARDGATRSDLEQIAERALAAWPAASDR
jgi:hypothetical protein